MGEEGEEGAGRGRKRRRRRWRPRTSWGRGGYTTVPTHPLVHGVGGRGVGGRVRFSFVIPFVISLVRINFLLGHVWAEGKRGA